MLIKTKKPEPEKPKSMHAKAGSVRTPVRCTGRGETVNLDKLINFPGRDIVIENMISRKDLDRARYDDLQIQRKIEEKRMAETTIRCNLKNKLKEEEAALRAAMGV